MSYFYSSIVFTCWPPAPEDVGTFLSSGRVLMYWDLHVSRVASSDQPQASLQYRCYRLLMGKLHPGKHFLWYEVKMEHVGTVSPLPWCLKISNTPAARLIRFPWLNQKLGVLDTYSFKSYGSAVGLQKDSFYKMTPLLQGMVQWQDGCRTWLSSIPFGVASPPVLSLACS